jgi:hypothetical protein
MQLQPADLIGAFYADDSLLWSAQDCVNWLPTVAAQKGTRTQAKLATPPGLSYFTQCGDGPIRGARDVEGKLFVVSGNELYEVAYDGTPTLRGTIPGVGLVSMSHNKRGYGNQLLIVNGDAGYVWDTTASTLTRITDEGYPGAVQVDYLDHYMIQVEPWGRFWFHSNLDNATDYNTLDRYDPEASPDKIKAIAANQLEAVTFSARTTEFFADTGAATGTFQSKRIVIERGIAGRFTLVKLDNTIMWLGNDGIFYRLNGYGAQPISTGPIHKAIAGLDWENAFGFVWEDKGYKVAYWTFPDGQTWGYDVTQPVGYQWHRRESYSLKRWRLNTCTGWQGRWIGGDYRTGVLYLIDWDAQHERGQPLVSERTGGTANANQNAVICPYIELIFDTGGPAWDGESGVSDTLTIAGDLPDGRVDDSGTMHYTSAGGITPKNFEIVSGSLPPGATMDAAGLVTYLYTTPGSYSWTVRVIDADGNTANLPDTAEVDAIDILAMGVAVNGTSPLAAYWNVTSWTSIDRTTIPDANRAVHGPDGWLAVGTASSQFSANLTSWTNRAGTGISQHAVGYGNGITLAIGNAAAVSSASFGVSWGAFTWTWGSPAFVKYLGDRWIAGLDGTVNGPYRQSLDGVTFTQGSASAMPYTVHDADYVDGVWYLCGGTSTTLDPGLIKKTLDWSGFTTLVSDAPSRVESMAFRRSDEAAVAVTALGEILYTSDRWQTHGVSATTVEATTGSFQVVCDGTYFFVVDNNGSGAGVSRRSLDGNTWEAPVAMPQAGTIYLEAD